MTNATTQAQTVTRPVGRPLSKRGRSAKRAVEKFLEGHEGTFTAADVRRVAKQSKVTVRNCLNAFEREGTIEKVGSQPVQKSGKASRGRPLAVYKRKDEKGE